MRWQRACEAEALTALQDGPETLMRVRAPVIPPAPASLSSVGASWCHVAPFKDNQGSQAPYPRTLAWQCGGLRGRYEPTGRGCVR